MRRKRKQSEKKVKEGRDAGEEIERENERGRTERDRVGETVIGAQRGFARE